MFTFLWQSHAYGCEYYCVILSSSSKIFPSPFRRGPNDLVKSNPKKAVDSLYDVYDAKRDWCRIGSANKSTFVQRIYSFLKKLPNNTYLNIPSNDFSQVQPSSPLITSVDLCFKDWCLRFLLFFWWIWKRKTRWSSSKQ